MKDQLKQIFSFRKKKYVTNKKLKAAAVLVPLFHDGNEYRVLLTRRSHEVFHHKGQISFPGGKPSKSDSSLLDTALRESWEEIGLQARDAEIIGELDDTPTKTTGFNISPFVALIPYPYSFVRNLHEIDEILDIPLAAFLDTAHCKQGRARNKSEMTIDFRYECNGRIIWGATARIIKQLVDTLKSTYGAREQ
jgi:8-oxo-dGTP pyrophosphatase MutT (NUDIX family)